ncbi:hypothetical protein B0H17DRAFT_1125154 [Mycena rosella]|uniref:Uncharacterized protein n=1 Tax=Mycena rosella TaxID=1033263 RepID=A0AAD7GXJ2_MYCRO|nr:hypothetical protein B0H17DRAFT_1125154 [Mycena rosella]
MDSLSPAAELEIFQLIADARTTNYLAGCYSLEHISNFQEETNHLSSSGLMALSTQQIRYYALVVVSRAVMFREMKSFSVPGSLAFNPYIPHAFVCQGVDIVWEITKISLYSGTITDRLTFGTLTILPLKQFLDIGQVYVVHPSSLHSFPKRPILRGCYSLSVLLSSKKGNTAYDCHLSRSSTIHLLCGPLSADDYPVIAIFEILIWNNGRATLAQVPVMVNVVVGARILLNIKNLGTEVHDGTIPTIEVSTIPPHRPRRTRVKVPWYLQTGEVSEAE